MESSRDVSKPRRVRRKKMSADDRARFTRELQDALATVCMNHDADPADIVAVLSHILSTMYVFVATTKRRRS